MLLASRASEFSYYPKLDVGTALDCTVAGNNPSMLARWYVTFQLTAVFPVHNSVPRAIYPLSRPEKLSRERFHSQIAATHRLGASARLPHESHQRDEFPGRRQGATSFSTFAIWSDHLWREQLQMRVLRRVAYVRTVSSSKCAYLDPPRMRVPRPAAYTPTSTRRACGEQFQMRDPPRMRVLRPVAAIAWSSECLWMNPTQAFSLPRAARLAIY